MGASDPRRAPPPPARRRAAVYDPVRDRIVVVGGKGVLFQEVWSLSLGDSLAWSHLSTAGTAPPPRHRHTAVYDSRRDRVIVFGGTTERSQANDVWALTLANPPSWSRLRPEGDVPGGGEGHAAVFDSTADRMMVLEGTSHRSPEFSDLWALELGDEPKWSRLEAVGVAPQRRAWHSAILDPDRRRVVLFGGVDESESKLHRVRLWDTWELSLSETAPEWTEITPVVPPPYALSSQVSVYDSSAQNAVLFGGKYSTPQGARGITNLLWTVSVGGTPSCMQLLPSGSPPAGRAGHSAVLDPIGGRMIRVRRTERQTAWGSLDDHAAGARVGSSATRRRLAEPPLGGTWQSMIRSAGGC